MKQSQDIHSTGKAMRQKAAGKSVLIVCNSFPPERGGAPNRIYHMAQALLRGGYQVSVVTCMPNYPTGKIFPEYKGRLVHRHKSEGIDITRIWVQPSNAHSIWRRGWSACTHSASLLLFLLPRLLYKKPEIVMVSSPPLFAAAWATILARLCGRKVWLNISDIWPQTLSDIGAVKSGKMFRVLYGIERRMYRRAALITGQSNEILDHVRDELESAPPLFLYRNLQPAIANLPYTLPQERRIIYAGVLGKAQGLLHICRAINFKALNLPLDIYGAGLERPAIEAYIKEHPDCGVTLHNTVPAAEMPALLSRYCATLVPLITSIRGAVPSKIFMAVANGIPIVYSGDGEAAMIVAEHGLGMTSAAGDIDSLKLNLAALSQLPEEKLQALRINIAMKAQTVFNAARQEAEFIAFLERLAVQ